MKKIALLTVAIFVSFQCTVSAVVCTWRCKNNLEAEFVDPQIPGSPPTIHCKQYTNWNTGFRSGYPLYADSGLTTYVIIGSGTYTYNQYADPNLCTELCSASAGPIPNQAAWAGTIIGEPVYSSGSGPNGVCQSNGSPGGGGYPGGGYPGGGS